MIMILVLGVLSWVLVLSTPLTYALFLVVFRILMIYVLVLNCVLSGLLGLLLLLVYLGAMIILISYVCAVVPNLDYESIRGDYRSIGGFVVVLVLVSVVVLSSSLVS